MGVDAVEKLYAFHNNLEFFVMISPWQHIPPAIMDSLYNGLAVFIVPLSFLNKPLHMQLMFKDTTRPGESSMPDEIYGTTPSMTNALQTSYQNKNHPS